MIRFRNVHFSYRQSEPVLKGVDLDIPAGLTLVLGPNGSGKSTINAVIRPELLGVYINPDDIEKAIRERGDFLDLASYGVSTSAAEILTFFQQSTLLAKADLLDEADALRFNDDKLSFFAVSVNAYFASVAADFIPIGSITKLK